MKYFYTIPKKTKKLILVCAFIFFFCFLLICCPLILFTNGGVVGNNKDAVDSLVKRDLRDKTRIGRLEERLIEIESSVQDIENKTLEDYKSELKNLDFDIHRSISENSSYLNEFYTLTISVNKEVNKSIIRIINNENNHIMGEKSVDGQLQGGYGSINEYSQNYNKIIFTIGPYFTGCEPGTKKEIFDACQENSTRMLELYNDVGGIWYFDVNTKDFVQIAKQSELYNGSPRYHY